jgi:hypothetical protein
MILREDEHTPVPTGGNDISTFHARKWLERSPGNAEVLHAWVTRRLSRRGKPPSRIAEKLSLVPLLWGRRNTRGALEPKVRSFRSAGAPGRRSPFRRLQAEDLQVLQSFTSKVEFSSGAWTRPAGPITERAVAQGLLGAGMAPERDGLGTGVQQGDRTCVGQPHSRSSRSPP